MSLIPARPGDSGSHNRGVAPPGTALVGWVVDVQRDFMAPDGRLYVRDLANPGDPGARLVTGALVEVVAWLRTHAQVLVYTGDWHGLDDPEIDTVAPDPARGTYPPHCMGRSSDPHEQAGAHILPEVAPVDPLLLEVDAGDADGVRVARAAVQGRRPVFIRKTRFDVFSGNAATSRFLASLEAELGSPIHFLVAGVARDVCVTQAVDGLLARGYGVTVVRDATWGLGLESEEATLARWVAGGATLTRVGDLNT